MASMEHGTGQVVGRWITDSWIVDRDMGDEDADQQPPPRYAVMDFGAMPQDALLKLHRLIMAAMVTLALLLCLGCHESPEALPDAGVAPAPLGARCEADSDCLDGLSCTDLGYGASICSTTCSAAPVPELATCMADTGACLLWQPPESPLFPTCLPFCSEDGCAPDQRRSNYQGHCVCIPRLGAPAGEHER